MLLLFEATNYIFERKFEEESLKVTKVTKKNLFNEEIVATESFPKESVVGYGTKVSKMFFFIEYIVVRESFEAS